MLAIPLEALAVASLRGDGFVVGGAGIGSHLEGGSVDWRWNVDREGSETLCSCDGGCCEKMHILSEFSKASYKFLHFMSLEPAHSSSK